MSAPLFSLRYFSPAMPLRDWVSSYYVFEIDLPAIADTLRAELPQVRFLYAGTGTFSYGGGPEMPMPRAALCGPTNVAVKFRARGPLRLFGAGLLPAGWAALVGESAQAFTDRMADLRDIAGPAATHALERMGEARSHGEIVAAADAFFLRLSMQAKPPPLWFTRAVDEWLSATINPDIDDLLAMTGMSSRQIERLALRIYGANPKLLARKYRALKAAVRLGLDPGLGWEAAAGAFYDQSHFIRDFRTFVGMTPGQFTDTSSPWLTRLTIAKRQALVTVPKLSRLS